MKIPSWVTKLMEPLSALQSPEASPPKPSYTVQDAVLQYQQSAARALRQSVPCVPDPTDTNDPYNTIRKEIRHHLLIGDETVTMKKEIFNVLFHVNSDPHPSYAKGIPWVSGVHDVINYEDIFYMHWYEVEDATHLVKRTRRIVIGDWRALAGI